MEGYSLLIVTFVISVLLLCFIVYTIWLKLQLWLQNRSLNQFALVHTYRTPRDDGAGSGCLVVLLFLITMSSLVALLLLSS